MFQLRNVYHILSERIDCDVEFLIIFRIISEKRIQKSRKSVNYDILVITAVLRSYVDEFEELICKTSFNEIIEYIIQMFNEIMEI